MATLTKLVEKFNESCIVFLEGLLQVYASRDAIVAKIKEELNDVNRATRDVPTVPITQFMRKTTPRPEVMDGFSIVDGLYALYLQDEERALLDEAKDLAPEERETQTQMLMATALQREPSTKIEHVAPLLDFVDNHLFEKQEKVRLKLRETWPKFPGPTKLWLVNMLFRLVNLAESYRVCEGDKTMQSQFENMMAGISGALEKEKKQ